MKDNNSEFTVHGIYGVSNSTGYEVEISSCGDSARLRYYKDVTEECEVSEWVEIIWEDMYDDDQIYLDSQPMIPIWGGVPLNEVIRVNA